MTAPARILIVDDATPIRRFRRVALKAGGFAVVKAATARAGIDGAALETPDALILDLGPPDGDGPAVLRAIREWSAVPVLVLSVRADKAGKVAALDAGAQDYVVNPFGVKERPVYLHWLLRDRAATEPRGAMIEIAGLAGDATARRVTRDGAGVRLTRKAFALPRMLMSQSGRLVTGAMILRAVRGAAHAEARQYLRICIRHLRARIDDDASDPRFIFTKPGIGYRFLSP